MRPYVQDLLLGLPAVFPEWQFKFFTPAWNEPFDVAHANVEIVVCRHAPKFRPARVLFEQTLLPRMIAREGVDIWLGTCNYLPLIVAARTLLLVQSHQYFTHPETFGRIRRAWLPWIVRRSAARADRIGVQCTDAARTLLNYVDVPPERVQVIYNRLTDLKSDLNTEAEAPDLRQLLGCDRPFLLYVSGFYPFKNHRRLIEAFERVKHLLPDLALVLVGGGQPEKDMGNLSEDVILTGRVPQAAIPSLYRNAIASVFPSLEETFGLPVLEAMSLDCPVMTSNRSSMAEIAGDAALLVDPMSVDSMADGMRRLILDKSLRERLVERGRQRYRWFTRDKTIAGVAEALRQVSALAYNTVGGSTFKHGSAGYTGTGVHFHPGPSSVRSKEVA
jgi:glycosyltransferase involved in cell wall biosynthesis